MIRKTRITALITALVMALALMPQLMVTAAGRNITISNETELIRFCDEVSQGKSNIFDTITLTADIVVHSDWRPIGTAYVPFYGTFDGNGHKITCLSINRDYTAFSGIFGHIASSAEIKNLTVQVDASGDFYFGGVVGYNNGGTVTNCCNTGTVSGSSDVSGVGAIVGYNDGGTATNCYYLSTCGAAGEGLSKTDRSIRFRRGYSFAAERTIVTDLGTEDRHRRISAADK